MEALKKSLTAKQPSPEKRPALHAVPKPAAVSKKDRKAG
jgi:hypothetical protein